MKKNSFYIVLPSNSCPKIQPNNEAGKYIVDMGNRIDFEDDWEVALTEFSFTFMTPMIEKGMHITYYNKEDVRRYYKYDVEITNGVYAYKLNKGDVRDLGLMISSLCGKMRISTLNQYYMEIAFQHLEDAKMLGFNEITISGKEVIAANPFFKYTAIIPIIIRVSSEEEVSRRINLDENIAVESNEKIASELMLQFSQMFSEITILNNALNCIANKNVTKVVFEPTFAKLLGFGKAEFDTDVNKKIIATRNIKPKSGQNHMYIYEYY